MLNLQPMNGRGQGGEKTSVSYERLLKESREALEKPLKKSILTTMVARRSLRSSLDRMLEEKAFSHRALRNPFNSGSNISVASTTLTST